MANGSLLGQPPTVGWADGVGRGKDIYAVGSVHMVRISELIEQRLLADGCEVLKEEVDDETITLGYKSEWRWLCRVHVLVATVDRAVATEEDVRGFTLEVLTVADSMNLRNGLQSGVLVMPILVAPVIGEEIPGMMSRSFRLGTSGFAAMAQPAVVDAGSGRVYTFRGRRLLGAAFVKLIHEKIETYLAALAEGRNS
ncbi:hypothetical protein EDC02_2852 [Micromonospora sp. Llam0]|uniref:hypothetical protein n=1 Tax=Micromonospora sp. Llam0 TaxID=2485143 RepID=UPI000F460D11|nr:hypothetical protein [Micromonospora sp. Llam0]ROO60933.1 hypothetical protein EDC02_2852 [Micromonospora sp. Llam0]